MIALMVVYSMEVHQGWTLFLHLTAEEEAGLESYLLHLAGCGFPVTCTMVKAFAWATAKHSGRNYRFHPEYGPGSRFSDSRFDQVFSESENEAVCRTFLHDGEGTCRCLHITGWTVTVTKMVFSVTFVN